ncbi:hypothetical protein ABIB99_008466 [Bradyrhizobium sp. LA6.1]|uniref:hypothetical protein n=1 Tax=Bradyrhizobium sp. LA6.1 TaxID=3156378 RepID=UPI003391129C
MPVVVSKRVKAGLRDPLPPGAAEAEFAYRMSRRIRDGIFEDIEPPSGAEVVAAIAEKLATPQPKIRLDPVADAEAAVRKLRALSLSQSDIGLRDVARILDVCMKWVKRMKQRDGWKQVKREAGISAGSWDIQDVIYSAELRVIRLQAKCRSSQTTTSTTKAGR